MLKKIVIAVVGAFALSAPAWAQTTPAQKSDTAKPSATQEKQGAAANARHEHMRDHKQGAPASMPTDADKAKKKKKPLHDHRKEHKQGG